MTNPNVDLVGATINGRTPTWNTRTANRRSLCRPIRPSSFTIGPGHST